VFERAKAVAALESEATVIGNDENNKKNMNNKINFSELLYVDG
jgi:hypothetical protein